MKLKTIIIFFIVFLIAVLQNNRLIEFNFLWMKFILPLWLILGLVTIIGFTTGLLLMSRNNSGTESESNSNKNIQDEEYLK